MRQSDIHPEPSYQSYGYFVNTDRKRLKLDQVQEVGCSGESRPPYVFTYYDAERVPRRLSYAQDHWGYYNGVNNSSLMPPNTPVSGSTTRSSCYPEMQAGTLQQISYPTGGEVIFAYEANQVWRQFYEEDATFKASHNASGITTITKKVTLAAGDYRVLIRSSSGSSDPKPAFLNISKTANSQESHSYGPKGDDENYDRIALSGGEYTLSARVADNTSSASMSLYLLSRVERNGNFAVGGLRVRTIINRPGNDQPDMVQTFDYQRGFSNRSSGVLFGRPVYRSIVRSDYNSKVSNRRDAGGRGISLTNPSDGRLDTTARPRPECFWPYSVEQNEYVVRSAQSIFPTEETQGYHIGYQQVKVVREDGSYTGYEYDVTSANDDPYAPVAVTTVEDYTCTEAVPNFPPAPLPYVPKRGQLVREVQVDASDQTVQDTEYSYTYEDDQEVVPGLIATSVSTTPFVTFYELQSAKLTARKVTTRTYDQDRPGQAVETVQHYRYDDPKHTQLTEQQTEVNSGTLRTAYRYAPDYTTGCEVSNACSDTYESDTQSCQAAFNATTSQAGCEFWTGCWYYAYKDYEACVSEVRSAYSQCNIDAQEASQDCLQDKFPSVAEEYQALLSLKASNQVGMPLEVSRWKDEEFLEATLTEYQDRSSDWNNNRFAVYPYQAFRLEPAQALPAARFSPSKVSGNGLTKDDEYRPKIEYLYEQGRPVQTIVEDGLPISYLYGYDYTLPVAKVVGATYAEAAAKVNVTALQSLKDDALRSELNNLRSISKAQVTTYTYDPLVGITSETDPNGRKMTYHYDDLNRLEWVESQEGHVVQKYDYQYATP